jgi:3-hydroxyisobutyrate dehydrogenase-like beta-hydroxyacid dehydrogenase
MSTVGFIGLGRLGSPFVKNLVEGGHEVLVCSRGRSDEAVAGGARIAGDGSVKAVAEAADVVLTCLPNIASLEATVGEILEAGKPTVIVELSTFAIPDKEAQRDRIVAAGGDMLDCPVSGTPVSAANREAVVFVSGEKATYDRVVEFLQALTPKQLYLGPFGNATNMKYVANFLAFTHVTVAAEAMAFAGAVGLDQGMVAKLISNSVAATSGQFNIRAPLMAEGKFDSALVTVDMMRKDLELITDQAASVGASAKLLAVVKDFYDDMAANGDGAADPAKLSAVLLEQAQA